MITAIIWTKEDCPNCDEVKAILKERLGEDRIDERDYKELKTGIVPDGFDKALLLEAAMGLSIQNDSMPVVLINEQHVDFRDILRKGE